MIRILNIQFGEYTKVTYMKHNGLCDETYQLKTKDLYRPEMIRQYEKMKELFLQWFPTFKFSANLYYLVGMGVKYNKHDDAMIDKVKVTGALENKAGSLCKVVSEWLPVGTSENKIIMEFLKEVVMFVKGERAQGKLFENTEIEEAIDAIDADDSHVFHVNDLQAKGVTQ